MGWSSPRTWSVGELVTKLIMDTHIRDNLIALWKGTTAGDMDYYSSATTKERLPAGTARKALTMNSGATAPEWNESIQSLLTTQGDVPYASSANTPARLPKGTTGQVLTMNAGATAPEWANNTSGFNVVGRQGGSSTDWITAGTANHTPSSTKVQTGVVNVTTTTASGSYYYGTTFITFPVAYTYKPIVLVSLANSNFTPLSIYSFVSTASGVTIGLVASTVSLTEPVQWLAIGT